MMQTLADNDPSLLHRIVDWDWDLGAVLRHAYSLFLYYLHNNSFEAVSLMLGAALGLLMSFGPTRVVIGFALGQLRKLAEALLSFLFQKLLWLAEVVFVELFIARLRDGGRWLISFFRKEESP